MTVANPKHILVPIDGSGTARRAMEYAAMLQGMSGCEVTLLYVFGHPGAQVIDNASIIREATEEEQQEVLQRMHNEKHSLFPMPEKVHSLIRQGSIIEEIVRCIEMPEFDLVVMGSRGLGAPVKRFFVGSVTKYVITHTSKPVLVMPEAKRKD